MTVQEIIAPELPFEVEPTPEPEPAEPEPAPEPEEKDEPKEPTMLDKWKDWLNNLMNVVAE